RLAVGLRHGRVVGLDDHVEAARVVLHRDRAGGAGGVDGGGERAVERGGVEAAGHRAAASSAGNGSPRSPNTRAETSSASTTTGMPPYVTCWKMTSATSWRVAPTLRAAWMCARSSFERSSTVSDATAHSSRCFCEMTSRL